MNAKIIFTFSILFGIVFSLTPVTGCMELNIPNEYYVLQNNIYGGNCIRINGENITFNLNGYNVNGYGGWGVVITDASGVSVENGSTHSTNGGIYIVNSQNSKIKNLATSTVSMNAIYVKDSWNISFIEVNYSRGCGSAGTALIFINTTESLIENSRCSISCAYNGEYDASSACVNLLYNSNNNEIKNNYFYNAYRNGVYIYQSTNNTISGNTIEHSHWYGIAVVNSENNSITGNTFVDSGLVHIYFEANGKNNDYAGNENEDGDPILVFIDQQDTIFENNRTSEIVLFNVSNATFRNITMVKGGINILGNGTANITFDEFKIRNAGAAIFMLPRYESIDFLNGEITDSTYGFYGTLDRDVYVENLNGSNIARYPIGLDVSGSGCGEISVSNYTVDGNEVVYTTSGGFSPPSGTYSQIFMCDVSTATLADSEITHALFSYYSDSVDGRRINISNAYIPVKVVGSDGVYFEDFAITDARIEGMNIQNSNNIYIYRTNITTIPDSSIPTFELVDWTYTSTGIYTTNVDGFVLNQSRVENAGASVWMRGYSKNVDIYGSDFRSGRDGVQIDNILYGNIESNLLSDFTQKGISVSYANHTEVKHNNLTDTGYDINNGGINFYGGKDISVYRNRISTPGSGIIFSSAYGIADYLTEFSVYENNILRTGLLETAGVYITAPAYGSTTKFEILDNNITNFVYGIRFLNAKNGTICRNGIDNSAYGVYIINSGELYFCDSEMRNVSKFPAFLDLTDPTLCAGTNFSNVTHEDEMVRYYNVEGIIIENINDASELILCDVNNSIVRNVEMNGNEGEMGILAVLSNRNEFYENTGDSVYSMTYLLRSNENNISNYTISNAQIGIVVDFSSNNKIENSLITGTTGSSVFIYRDSDNNIVEGLNITGQTLAIYSAGYLAENNIVIKNDINGTASGDKGITIANAKYTRIEGNRIYDGEIQIYANENNVSYNNFTGRCSGWQCIVCSGEGNIIYKNFFTLSTQPPLSAIKVSGTTNYISRNYFANIIVGMDSGNTGCGNLYGIVNVSGPTDVTNRSCFPGKITEVEIYPTPVYESSNALCRAYYTHEDPYDAENVQFRWYVNDIHLPAYDGYGSGSRDSWIESNVSLPANESSAGDNITCEVRAYDGTYWSEWKNTTVQVIPDTCGVYANETDVYFGALTTNVISAEKSITITNSGTIPGNFSINGTNWVGPSTFSSTRTRWNTTSGSYETKTPITNSPALVYENLPGGDFFTLYLQLYTPIGQQNGTYNQTITILAECP
ncbi:MAG: right-handed parallel beta-helix repeat-containing protein [Candidatus Anstonellales archaeon]